MSSTYVCLSLVVVELSEGTPLSLRNGPSALTQYYVAPAMFPRQVTQILRGDDLHKM